MSILKSTGNPDIDNVHQKMVTTMNTIIEHTKNGHSVEELKEELKGLYHLAANHFNDEDELMRDIKYPFSTTHILAHQEILSKIKLFLEILDHTKQEYNGLLNVLLRIVEKHVEHYDVSLFKYNEIVNQQAGMVSNG